MKTLLKKSATLKTISSKISTYLHEINACDSGCHAENHLLRGTSKGLSVQSEQAEIKKL